MIGKFPHAHINWLEYESLMQAIPANWKLIINVPDNSTYLHKCDKLTGLKKTSKLIYTRLISKEDNLYCRNMCWKWELNVNIELVNLHNHSQNLYKVTNNTKLRNFQYKLLTRTLVTNKHLKQWKIKEEENCAWCLQEVETYEHFLVKCEKVSRIWKLLEEHIKSTAGTGVMDISTPNIVFNLIHLRPGCVFNLITLITKQLLYRYRCMYGKLPSFQNVMDEIHEIKETECLVTMGKNHCSVKYFLI